MTLTHDGSPCTSNPPQCSNIHLHLSVGPLSAILPKLAPLPRNSPPRSGVSTTLFRYLFPQTRRRARVHLNRFRNEYIPHWKHRTQSRIYKYILHQQRKKLLRKSPTLRALWKQRGELFRPTRRIRDAASRRWPKMTQYPAQDGSWSNGSGSEDPPPGSKRAKFKGYLKAANELRQTYQQQYTSGWNQRNTLDDYQDGLPGGYPDAAVVTSGHEQMILFPSYAHEHVKRKPKAQPGTIQETPGQGRDYRDTVGAGDAEFMKQQWEKYEEDNAVVDVDVRGWVFSPHKGQMSRRQRVFVSLARQLAGLPAPSTPSSSTGSSSASRDASPHTAHRQRVEERAQERDEEEAARQAEKLVKKGEAEAEAAGRGEYSEHHSHPSRNEGTHSPSGRKVSEADSLRRLAASNAAKPDDDDPKITPVQRRQTWNHPANMSPEELAAANAHLMARLAPFMSNPLEDTPISAFFYNDTKSRQRTIYTNNYGHFALRASLDFVPTHVRILASEKLSATEEVNIISSKGISLISDIDDTIKHSAISSGAREIFRNAFIRDLSDLNIDGVQEWYSRLAKMGVNFHYVSNSPWQLYPVLQKYFAMTGLPPGSFHLKQYSGMLQGIFEPVAERKKSTLDHIANDFPERRFILVGDSGEADLEVYLDFVAENPGRVLAIMIRDVTTPHHSGFFDSSMGSLAGPRSGSSTTGQHGKNGANVSQALNDDDDPELKAAIAASLKTMEEEEMRSRPGLPPRRPTDPGAVEKNTAAAETEDLIDLSDDTPIPPPSSGSRSISTYTIPPSARKISASNGSVRAPPPSIPRKPLALQGKAASPSPSEEARSRKPPPPPSRRSTTASTPSTTPMPSPPMPQSTRPPTTRERSPAPSVASTSSYNSSYRESARQKLASAYNSLPAVPWNSSYVHTELNRGPGTSATTSLPNNEERGRGPPPPPPRRNVTAYPAAAASRVTNAWTEYNDPGRGSAHEQSVARNYSTATGGGSNGSSFRQEQAQPINKRLELWQQRWDRAQQYCAERGVVLRSWTVGDDVVEECVRLVKRAGKEDGTEDSDRRGRMR